jgi:hypothetical protein
MYFIYFYPLQKSAFCAIEQNSRLTKRQRNMDSRLVIPEKTRDRERRLISRKKKIQQKEGRQSAGLREELAWYFLSILFFFNVRATSTQRWLTDRLFITGKVRATERRWKGVGVIKDHKKKKLKLADVGVMMSVFPLNLFFFARIPSQYFSFGYSLRIPFQQKYTGKKCNIRLY